MRILLLGPVHRELKFQNQKENLSFLKGQGQQSWVEALERLGHEVFVFRHTDSILIPNIVRVVFSELFGKLMPLWKARYDRFSNAYYFISLENFLKNKKLLAVAKKIKPQLIIISGGVASIYSTTIKVIKDHYKCKVLLFSGVNPLTSSTPVERIMIHEEIIDIVVENDRGYAENWEKLGARKTIVLPISGVDSLLHRRLKLSKAEQKEYGCDVCFVGSLTRDRQEILNQVQNDNRNKNVDLKIWGDIPSTVKLDKRLNPYYNGLAFGEKMVKIFNAAKIVLNFQPRDMTHGGNMRSFEIPGCGAFQLADKVDPRWIVFNKEVILFKDINDLSAKISYYLIHESKRRAIAENGYKRVHEEHTYDKHFKKLLSQI